MQSIATACLIAFAMFSGADAALRFGNRAPLSKARGVAPGKTEASEADACTECLISQPYLNTHGDSCVCHASDIMNTFANDATKELKVNSGYGSATTAGGSLTPGWMWHCAAITQTTNVWKPCPNGGTAAPPARSSSVDAQGKVAEESVHVANKVHVRREDTVKRAPLIRREVSRVEAPKAALIQEHAAATTVGQEVGGEAGNTSLLARGAATAKAVNHVVSGPCTIDANGCAMSPNWPAHYGNSQGCEILFQGTISAVGYSFSVERVVRCSSSDYLYVMGKYYCWSSGGPPIGTVMAADGSSWKAGTLVWRADSSVSASGWRLCLEGTKLCTCSNGVAATGSSCTSNGVEKCASCNDGFYLEDNTCKTKATCDSFTFPTTCPTDAPVHGGSGVECSTDIASCDSSTCCEACPNSDGVTGYKFDHLGYWHHAHIAQGSTTTDGDCAGKCDAYPDCIAFNRNQNNGDCFVYTILNTEAIGPISKAYTKCTILNDRPSDQAMPTLTNYSAWSPNWCSSHYGGTFTPVADLVAACDADDQCQGIWWTRGLNLGVRCSSASFQFTHHNDQECAAKTPLNLLLTKETVSARGDGQPPCLQSCNLQDKKVLEHGDKCTPSCSEGMAAKDAEFECKDGELYDGDAIADPEDLKCK